MANLRVSRVALRTPTEKRLRVSRVALSGAAKAPRTLRVSRVALTGARAVLLDPITAPPQAAFNTSVTVTAVLSASSATGTTTWTWRRVSGPAVTLTPSGSSVTFLAPAAQTNPTDTGATIPLTLGVRATVDGITSAESLVTVPLLPQTHWSYDGTAWVGSRTRQP